VQPIGSRQWAVDSGTVDTGQYIVGRSYWALDSGQLATGGGHWPVHSGHYIGAVDSG
jgi:hypothetical protein